MSNLPELSGSSEPKFLTTTEKAARYLTWGGIGTVAGVALYNAFPYIIEFEKRALEAGFRGIILGGLLTVLGATSWVLLNPTFRAAVWYWGQGIVDKLAFAIVKIDPVTRLRSYVSHYLRPTMEKIRSSRDRAAGRLKTATGRLEENQAALSEQEKRAAFLQSHGMKNGAWVDQKLHTQFSTASAKIRTMREAVKRLEKRQNVQQGYVAIMEQLLNVVSAYVEVTEFNVDMLVQEFESTQEMADGTREVQGLLSKSEKTRLANMTAEHMTAQINTQMAEVEGVMRDLQQQIDAGKIDDAINEESLMQELSAKVGNMSTFAETQRQLTSSGEPALFIEAKTKMAEVSPVDIRHGESITKARFGSLLPPQ